jgi:hypothetical protein
MRNGSLRKKFDGLKYTLKKLEVRGMDAHQLFVSICGAVSVAAMLTAE